MPVLADVLLAVDALFFVRNAFAIFHIVVDLGHAFVLQVVVANARAELLFVAVHRLAVQLFVAVLNAAASCVIFGLRIPFGGTHGVCAKGQHNPGE